MKKKRRWRSFLANFSIFLAIFSNLPREMNCIKKLPSPRVRAPPPLHALQPKMPGVFYQGVEEYELVEELVENKLVDVKQSLISMADRGRGGRNRGKVLVEEREMVGTSRNKNQ
jgi:hypothetical protein